MAYATLSTRNANGLNPNFRGIGNYALLSTRNTAGLHPNFRGLGSTWSPAERSYGSHMGQVPLTSMSIGPGGQFSISSATTPTSTSIFDQMLTWLGDSSIVAGMPNSVFAIGGAILLLSYMGRGGGRRRY
jgi:hypothetical protein